MLEFGPFRLEPDRRELLHDGMPVAIQAKLFDTLVVLVENRDRVVEKDELLDAVWPDTHVGESTLFQTVSALRKVLSNGTNGDRYIATIPGRGYQFVSPITTNSGVRQVTPTLGPNGSATNGSAGVHSNLMATDPASEVHREAAKSSSEPGRSRRWLNVAVVSAVAAALAAGLIYWRPEPSTPFGEGGTVIRRLTSAEGWEWQPGWSPDGRSFAYSGGAFGSADIFVAPTAGGDALRRTTHPADEFHPRWSPDGRYIAFMSDRGTGASVYVMSPYDGPERKLADTGLHRDVMMLYGLGMQPWSPGSNKLIFPRRHPNGSIAIWKVDLATGEEVQVTHPPAGEEDRDASISFGGSRIVFRGRREGKKAVWIANSNGEIEREAFADGSWPAWAPDDRSIYVSSGGGGGGGIIRRFSLADGNWFQVTRSAGDTLMYPAVAADGAIAFTNFRHSLHLYRTRLADGETVQLTDGTSRSLNACVSPDGTKVAYQSGRSGNTEIWILDTVSGEDLQLTHHPASDSRPDWSPDGKQIAFRSGRDGGSRIWVIESEGGVARQISSQAIPLTGIRTASVEGNAAPRWSPDGDRIGYIAPTDDGFSLWVTSLEGEATPVDGTQGAFNFGWYFDHERVILSRVIEDGAREMVAMNVKTGTERLLHRGPHYEVAVAADRRAVSFSHNLSHMNQNLFILRLTPPDPGDGLPRPQGEPEQVTDGKGIWHVHNGGWFPDGKSVVYTRDTDQADIFMVEPQ